MTGHLATTLMARRPFRPGRRGDGTPLANYFDGHRVLGEPRLLAALADELYLAIARTDADLTAGEVAAGAQLPPRWHWPVSGTTGCWSPAEFAACARSTVCRDY